jgi:hypothetical protein
METMALPAAPHTFALENCRSLLDKLEWEIERLHHEAKQPDPGADEWGALVSHVDALKYGAFNSAVTAWSLSDWVFEDRETGKGRKPTGKGLKAFQDECRSRSDALRFCHLIANGSKHGGVDRKKKIDAEVWSDGNRWRITITYAGQKHDAVAVFHQALDFWTNLINSEQIAAC